jgi:hypothetical protein
MKNELNITRFAEALARALTVQYSRDIPGVKISVKSITPKAEVRKSA